MTKKLVIEVYEEVLEGIVFKNKNKISLKPSELAILHGTPLPEDATNGDIFKAMFSNLRICENRDNKDYPYIEVFIGEHDSTCYPKEWWNSPYNRGEKNEIDN